MSERPGLKGRLARMFLNFLDEHGDYRTQLEEAAARAAAATAGSMLAKDRERLQKKRRRGRFGLSGDDDDEHYQEIEQQPPNTRNQLPEDPYDQVQFYIRTFRQRTYEQFAEQIRTMQLELQNWAHDELHHRTHVPVTSVSLSCLCALVLMYRRRRAHSRWVARIHGIMGKKYVASSYLHPNVLRGYIGGEYTASGWNEIQKLSGKASKAEEAALASMRPYQRKKYERLQKLERIGERIVTVWLIVGMVASLCCALLSVGRLYGHFVEEEVQLLDGHIYSMDGPTDNDGYPLDNKNEAEENYAACLAEAEGRGVEDPTTVCNVHDFFEAAEQQEEVLSPLRQTVLQFLSNTSLPPTLSKYIATLPTQTIAYLSSLFSFGLFLFSHYISHKIHVSVLSNDPMKHFVATANDDTIKADGTVVAKKGETEAQRKRRERMLQQEKMKAQMAQLAMEAKQKVDERRRRLEGEEAVKKEEEEAEVKKKEERDETVKMYSRQFMMLKAGVPEGAILNTFLAEGIEDEEGKEILEKLKEIKEKRAEEARKEEEAEETKRKKEAEEEKEKERIATERLRLMRMGSFGGSSAKKPQSTPGSVGQPSFVRGKSVGSAPSSTPSFSKANLRKSIPMNSSAAKSNDGTSSPTTSSIATASTTRTTTSSKKEDPSIAKSKMLGDIATVSLGSLRKTKTPTGKVGVKVIEGSTAEGNSDNSSPLGTKKVWDTDSKAWVSTTPLKSNVTPAVKSNFIQSRLEEEKKENESSPTISKQVSELTSVDGIDLDESPTPPLLTRVSSPSTDFVSGDTVSNPSDLLETPSGWGKRLTAAELQAQIEAVEDEDDEEESIEHEPQDLNLGPNSFYSPGFDQAIRNSNASWDRRPSSRDIMARIKEAEELEAKHAEVEDDLKRAEMIRSRTANKFGRDLGSIGENQAEPTNTVEVRRKTKGDDDNSEVSELSMTTYEENALDLSKGRSIPHALFLRQDSGNKVPFSPALTSSPSPGFLNSKGVLNEKAQEAIRMAERGELNLPPMPVIHDESSSTVKSSDAMSGKASKAESREETEEERFRRERAEKRAKKMEEMAARRNKGEDDGTSVSGLSKLRRRRKKMVQDEVNADSKELPKEDPAPVIQEETVEEKQRRLRAEKRAKKMEEMAAKRNAGKDDDTAVSGISKHHRLRRKKSALAADAEVKAKNDWCNSIFASVVNAEQIKWQSSIYKHVLVAQQTRESNVALSRSIEEMDEQARRIRDNQKKLEARAKKFANKADRFHKLRQEGASHDDESSVVSSTSRMRRRRARKSTSKPMATPVEEAPAEETITQKTPKPVMEQSPAIGETLFADDKSIQWSNQIFTHVISAAEKQWKTIVFSHVLNADSKRGLRLEVEALVEGQRSLAEARMEKGKQNELRAKKMEMIQSSRRDFDEENISPETKPASTSGGSSMKKMRDRRKKAALAKKAAQS